MGEPLFSLSTVPIVFLALCGLNCLNRFKRFETVITFSFDFDEGKGVIRLQNAQ